MARSSECTEQCAQKVFDSADIVREAIFRQSLQTLLEFMENQNSLQDVRSVRIWLLAARLGIEFQGDVDVVLAANDRDGLIRNFDQIVPSRPYKAHIFASEVPGTAHLAEWFSIRVEVPLNLLTAHSRLQISFVLGENGLVPNFALACLAPISQPVKKPQSDTDCCHCGNDQ